MKDEFGEGLSEIRETAFLLERRIAQKKGALKRGPVEIRAMASVRARPVKKERAESYRSAHEVVRLEGAPVDVIEQKWVYDELRASEVRFRSVFDNSLDAIVIMGPDGEIVSANRSAQSLLGMTEVEISRAGRAGIIVQNEALAEAIETLGKTGKWRGILTCKRKDGSTFPVDVSSSICPTSPGTRPFTTVTFRYITERNQAENEMRDYRNILSKMADGVVLVRVQDGAIVYTNPHFDRMFGHGAGELLGRHMNTLNATRSEGAQYGGGEIMDALGHNGQWSGETCHAGKDGARFWCHVRFFAFHHFTHGPVWIGIVTDITAQKRLEEGRRKSELAQHKSEHLLRAFMDSCPAIAWIKNEQGRMVYLSRSFEDHFGAYMESWIDKSDADIWPPDLAERYRNSDLAVLEAGQPMEFVEPAVSPDGSPSKWMSVKFPLHVSGSRFIAGIGLDVSARKNAEEKIAENRRRLETLLEEQTLDLEEKTQLLEDLKAAIRVLLRQRDDDRKELEERFLANMRQLVIPYAEKLKQTRLDEGQMACLGILETHCQEIMSPFMKTLQLHNLTPTESQVSSLIKAGKTTKEIASILGVASSSIDTHRKSIRKKYGLSNTQVNLVTYLRSLEG